MRNVRPSPATLNLANNVAGGFSSTGYSLVAPLSGGQKDANIVGLVSGDFSPGVRISSTTYILEEV